MEEREKQGQNCLQMTIPLPPISSENGDDHGNSTADTSDTSEKSETEAVNESSNSAGTSASDKDKPVHKWPIRPGVHVHVNGLHVLNNSNASETKISGFSYGARNNSTTASDTNLDKDRTGLEQLEDETSRNNTVARGTSTSDMMRHNETMAAQNNSAGDQGTSQGHAQAASAALTAETGLVNNSNSFEFCMYYSKVD